MFFPVHGGSVMAINDLTSAIIEKRGTVQRLKAEIQQIEKDLEVLTAAAHILERGSTIAQFEAPPPPGPASVRGIAQESIKKAFP
jgi:wobble nucleotide-excising tRNase